MGKYDMKKQKKSSALPVWIGGGCVILAAVAIVVIGLLRNGTPVIDPNTTTQPSQTTTAPIETTVPTETTGDDTTEEDGTPLGNGLTMSYLGKYAGIFMEDGTDEIVSNVMMMILRNDSADDLQLARINLHYSDYTAQFEVTNLPAGESVVLLEKNRRAFENDDFTNAKLDNVVFFAQPMTIADDRLQITGGDGYLDVKNISGEDISGEILLYYKNSATDLLYGGITYRTRISDGIKAGETVRVMAGHYREGSNRLVMVTCGE